MFVHDSYVLKKWKKAPNEDPLKRSLQSHPDFSEKSLYKHPFGEKW